MYVYGFMVGMGFGWIRVGLGELIKFANEGHDMGERRGR